MTSRPFCRSDRALSPEDVLQVFRDWHRQQLQFDPEAQAGVDLDFSTSVAEWRRASDLLSWQSLGIALGQCWHFSASAAQWREVLEPARVRTLRDVCSFISRRAEREDALPPRLLGACCVGGGMFEVIRELLGQDGADVGHLKPSDALEPFLYRHSGVFLGPIAALSPGRLPALAVHSRLESTLQLLFVGGLIAAATCDQFDRKRLAMACLAIGFIAIAITWAVPCSHMEFPGIVSFRDLVECLLAPQDKEGSEATRA